MNRSKQFVSILLSAAIAGVFLPAVLRADAPATQPAAAARTARPMAAVEADLNAAGQKLQDAVPSPRLYADARFRKENAGKVLPLLKNMSELLAEASRLSEIAPETSMRLTANRIQTLSLAVALGDQDAHKALTDISTNKADEEAIAAKSALALGRWLGASEDPAAQQKILDEFTLTAKETARSVTDLTAKRDAAKAAAASPAADKPADPKLQKDAEDSNVALARANVQQDIVADALFMMWDLGAADEKLRKALAVIKTNLNSEGAKQAVTAAEAEEARRRMIGRPFNLAGRNISPGSGNQRFHSNQWKGKVILVDFWATWCGPCVESLPELKKIYTDYHAKGLEVVGVDLDTSDDRVIAFIKEKGMPWPQLREQSQTDDNPESPLAKRFGVEQIPTLFLIDKKGNLRYIDARESTEEKVKKLLEEPDPTAKPAEPAKK